MIKIPRIFVPRSYQTSFMAAMRAGVKRHMLVWHRRAGKDATALNATIEKMIFDRAGTYYYFLPTYAQAKKIIWSGLQGDGVPFLDHFPRELIIGRNETEMSITLARPDGQKSIFQLIGADNIDSIVGTNPIGIVMSEYSLMSPKAWNLMRPVLAENKGWAVFIFTPRGRNWAAKDWELAKKDPSWFTSTLTVDQTIRDSATDITALVDGKVRYMEPVTTREDIDRERAAGMAEELIQQEFYCSFEGAMQGSYYGDAIERMRKEGRITAVPYDPDIPVDTSWDVGVDDETVIGFWQHVFDPVRGKRYIALIDYERGHSHGLQYYNSILRAKGYDYGRHYAPHDMKVQEWGTGNTRVQTASLMGLHFEVVKKIGLADGIEAVRRMLPYVLVDEVKCEYWVNAMIAYRREFDEEFQTFRNIPKHDWASHTADMTRYRAIEYQARGGMFARREGAAQSRPTVGNNDWSVFDPPGGGQTSREEEQFHSRTRWGKFHE